MSSRTFLEEISIKNLGIIEHSSIEFSPGFNALTGETGAGKTMILTALSLILGGKSDSALVKQGADRLVASAQFTINQEVALAINASGSDVDGNSVVFSRSVSADGKSKAILGGVTVAANILTEIGSQLVEIHGQSANTQLSKPARQRELLDRFGGSEVAKVHGHYLIALEKYLEIKVRLKSLRESASKRGAEIAELEEFALGWKKLKPVRGEFEGVESEISKLSNVEGLREAISTARGLLLTEESGATSALSKAREALASVQGKDLALDEITQRFLEGYFQIDEASKEIASYEASLGADPARLDQLQGRKAEILTFVKRWSPGADIDEQLVHLSVRAKSAQLEVEDLKGGDARIAEVEKALEQSRSTLLHEAINLSELRAKVALRLEKLISVEIHELSMPHTNLFIQVIHPDYSAALKESDFGPSGADEVAITIESHSGAPRIALGKGASGGEMSRIALAIEVVIASTRPIGTYIFDEIDAGVGGKAAIEVGRRLHKLSQHAQVIVVTHLPQVAAWADSHFVVKKSSDGAITLSGVEALSDKARVEEIARMLAGLEGSKSAQEHASELLAMRG